jgi:PhzF family phenazine biosynthesis protein
MMQQLMIDAFATAPFKGNPACVVEPFDQWPSSEWMQALAQENNQSETAFLRRSDHPARFDLRWFTPSTEVPLCGHATLASAHALFSHWGLQAPSITFDTHSGPLKVTRMADGRLEMDFPANPPVLIDPLEGLSAAIGVEIEETWRGAYVVAWVKDEAAVRAAQANSAEIERICTLLPDHPRGNLIVAALAAPGLEYDVVSRFFAPGSGVAEDPATGSAHCILAPLYAQKTGKTEGHYHQAFPGRGGELQCVLSGDRVLLRGRAMTVLDARLLV